MTENQRSPSQRVVDILVAIHIGKFRPRAMMKEQREGPRATAQSAGHPARQTGLRPLESFQRARSLPAYIRFPLCGIEAQVNHSDNLPSAQSETAGRPPPPLETHVPTQPHPPPEPDTSRAAFLTNLPACRDTARPAPGRGSARRVGDDRLAEYVRNPVRDGAVGLPRKYAC